MLKVLTNHANIWTSIVGQYVGQHIGAVYYIHQHVGEEKKVEKYWPTFIKF